MKFPVREKLNFHDLKELHHLLGRSIMPGSYRMPLNKTFWENSFCKMIRLICVAIIGVQFLFVSCGKIEEKNIVTHKGRTIEFLGTGSCANSPVMEKNLQEALTLKGLAATYNFIDIKELPESDYRRGYGTPTVLVNGMDIFGAPRPLPTSKAPS